MDTIEFLSAVLPKQGRRCIGVLANGAFRNFFGTDIDKAAERLTQLDTAGKNTYFALAGFGEENSRKQSNVVAVRSFWLDIDTGEGNIKYPTRREGLADLLAFIRDLDLPKPLLTSSGNGIHVYWPCEADIKPAPWKRTATLLKRACKVWGLVADPTRTADSASVLRPVGTRNHKDASNPKAVKVIQQGDVTSHALMHLRLETYLTANDQLPDEPVENLNSDLITKREFLPSLASKIVEHCGAMREVRDVRGNVTEPFWYGALGVLAATVDGKDLYHEWSSGHPNYTKRETDYKYARSGEVPPTTCERFSDYAQSCATCVHRDKIRSPISLGTPTGVVEPVAEEFLPEKPDPKTALVDIELPSGYAWGVTSESHGKPCLHKKVVVPAPTPEDPAAVGAVDLFVSPVHFYPTTRVQDPRGLDALYSMNILMHDEQRARREFVLDTRLVSDQAGLAGELTMREIPVTSKNKAAVSEYLAAWVNKLRADYPNVPKIGQFGWRGDDFVIGQDMLTYKGEHRAILTNSAVSFGQHLGVAGNLEDWVEAVDTFYNHPGQEALQFCVLGSFAAPLWSLFGEKGGITVYAHSVGSGYGKSTAQKVGLSAWGYHPKLALHQNSFTKNALFQHIGVMQHLPVVVDELTNADPSFCSDLVYSVSEGTGKSRLTATSTLIETLDWSTIAMASGNLMLTEKLEQGRGHAEAEMMRTWEFTIQNKGKLDPNAALDLVAVFQKNYGHAGRKFVEYVMHNRDAVIQELYDTRRTLNTRLNIEQAERFWSQLHACIITALNICLKLRLLKFDKQALIQWITHEMRGSREQLTQSISSPIEQFSEMVADIHKGILVTSGQGQLTSGAHAPVLSHPTGPIVGRHMMEDKHTPEKLYLSVAAIREWCGKRRVSAREMYSALANAGWVDKTVIRVSLGRGTEGYSGVTGQVRCWDVNPNAIRAVVGTNPVAQKVCGVIRGGGHDAVGNM